MPLDPVEILQRLIQTPSVNPMGQEPSGPTQGEGRMTELLTAICREHGWPCVRQQVHPGRENLLVFVAGDRRPDEGGELLLWDVHQDTVPVTGMSIDPFAGEVRDGRIYGRGASDVKGSMAAMLAALSRLHEAVAGPDQQTKAISCRPSIVLACTANEEFGFTGAKAVAGSLADDRLWPGPPDAAIVAEPTELNVVVAHQGVVRWRCHTLGVAAHTSRPNAGVNAIYGMANVVRAIEAYHAELTANAPEHNLCGRPAVCVSTIHGGSGINTVPDRVTVEIDRRLGPSEAPAKAYDQLVRYVADHADIRGCRIGHDAPFQQSVGLNDNLNRTLAERLVGVVRRHGRHSERIGVPYGTDAAAIAATGVPTIVFGPGSIRQAHTADEFIAIDELRLAVEIFYDIALNGLSNRSAIAETRAPNSELQ